MSPVRVTDMRWSWVRKNLLLLLTFSGVLFGVALGLALRAVGPDSTTILLISYPGELFIRMLKLMILPLIIASLISGSASLNAKINGYIVVRTILYFMATSLLNALIGVLLVVAIHPGSPLARQALTESLSSSSNTTSNVNILDGFLDLGRNIFPENIFRASFQQVHTVYEEQLVTQHNNITGVDAKITEMVRSVKYRAGTNTLGIIVFCLVFGTLLGSLGKKGAVVVDFFSVIDTVILKIVTGVMWLSPLGVASVIMSKILSVENLGTVMSNLGLFIVTVVVGVFIYQWIIQNLLYFIFTRKNPLQFYFHLLEPWVTSFATASTSIRREGVEKEDYSVVLRLSPGGDAPQEEEDARRERTTTAAYNHSSSSNRRTIVFFQPAGCDQRRRPDEHNPTQQCSLCFTLATDYYYSIHETREHDLAHNARTVNKLILQYSTMSRTCQGYVILFSHV
ncbi:excitatory amino acid transporter 2-like isoform X3 [Portunus trituberculatus]|uniref:excitatory amino acid transporter 2-like isoform X3 n=1 Tax=Portunus trituberculatus TaxID=210409 RepID=UPI001E1D0D03|nr:excitatory amino acid transporter 2-like isoform X3 [Portunus trituberculatus]